MKLPLVISCRPWGGREGDGGKNLPRVAVMSHYPSPIRLDSLLSTLVLMRIITLEGSNFSKKRISVCQYTKEGRLSDLKHECTT